VRKGPPNACLLLLILLTSAGFLLANDTAVFEYPDGSGVVPMTSADVRMVQETVRITCPEGTRADVEASFTFRNLGQETVAVTMGFPFTNAWGEHYETDVDENADSPEKLRFVSLVDGVAVETRVRTEKKPDGEDDFPPRTRYFVWDVSFEPGQTRELVTRYSTEWRRWNDVDDRFGYMLTYITTSGAAWAGNIGKATISIQMPADIPRPSVGDEQMVFWEYAPGAPAMTSDFSQLSWTLENWEPTSDISVQIQGQRFGHYDQFLMYDVEEEDVGGWDEARVEELVARHPLPRSRACQALINAVFARAGHRFDKPELQQLYGRFDWYEPKAALTVDTLPAGHAKTVRAALAVKARHEAAVAKAREGPHGEYYTEFALRWLYTPDWYLRNRRWEARFQGQAEREKAWLKLARNAIYAHNGRSFEDADLAAFFAAMPWYRPLAEPTAPYEDQQKYLDVFVAYEEQKGYR
jgi:YARHG domain/Domain of unknown function (DUF4424)